MPADRPSSCKTWAGISREASTARYYEPQTAQFLTRDPLPSRNRDAYGYVNNDPLNGSDPSGLMCRSPSCLLNDVHVASDAIAAVAGRCALVAGLSIMRNAGVSEACGAVALAAAEQASTGFARYENGQEGGGQLAIDAAGFGLGAAGVGLGSASTYLGETADAWGAMKAGATSVRSLHYSVRWGLGDAGSAAANYANWLVSVPTIASGS